jgi:Zn-dependent metalloprotease
VSTLLAALVAALALVASVGSAAADPGPRPAPDPSPAASAERGLRAASDVAPTLRKDRAGRIRSITAKAGHPLRRPSGVRAGAPAETVARAFVDAFGAGIGLADGDAGLTTESVVATAAGDRIVRFQQRVGGLPVIGGDVVVTTRANGQVLGATGEISSAPGEGSSATGEVSGGAARPEAPRVSLAEAVRIAMASVGGARTADLRAEASRWMFDPQLVGARGLPGLRQVWRVEVTGTGGRDVRRLVLVDAALGAVTLNVDLHEHARERLVCDFQNLPPQSFDPACEEGDEHVARGEGDAASSVEDVNDAYEYTGATYDFYFRHFGRDSIDDAGVPLLSSVRVCVLGDTCPYPNAYWDGEKMVFGEGFAGADDVVGHELTHGVTEYTSELYYAYQSGAINESLSDIFGEFIDQQYDGGPTTRDGPQYDWLIGEDLPPTVGVLRNMADPTQFGEPDRMTSPHYAGESHDEDPDSPDDSGGVHANSGVGNKAAYLMTAPGTRTFNGVTVTGLGIDKAAQIYYRTMHLLTAGADYVDLAAALDQACENLATAAVAGIVAADCVQVRNATAAVEMTAQPLSPSAQAPDAARCPSGATPAVDAADDFDGNPEHPTWTVTSDSGDGFTYVPVYAHSGRWALVGLTGFDEAIPKNTATWAPFSVPAGRSTYLWFAQSFMFDTRSGQHYDGGRVEYRVDEGAWTDAAPLFIENGYNVNLNAAAGAGTGRFFGGDSHGWGSSRLDLSPFAGRTVQLRFAVFASRTIGSLWLIDDVQIYQCMATTATTSSAPRQVRVTGGDPGSATVSWLPPEVMPSSGLTGYEVAAVPAVSGLPATVSVGGLHQKQVGGLAVGTSYTFTVTPQRDGSAGPSASVTAKRTTVTLGALSATVAYGRPVWLTGQVTVVGGGTASGTAKLFGRRTGTATWGLLASTPVAADGRFRFAPAPATNVEYRAQTLHGADLLSATSSPTAVRVSPLVRIAASASAVRRASMVRFSGTTTPVRRYMPAYLQVYAGSGWRTIATTRTYSGGGYGFAVRLNTRGRFSYRVAVAADPSSAAGTSASVVVRVR